MYILYKHIHIKNYFDYQFVFDDNSENESNDNFGFILLRHVNSHNTNKYWIESYNCIRLYYPNSKIIIIDDNSNYDYITDIELTNAQIINSEFKGRGEILPYYYYLKYNFFDRAIIIHDSVFIQKYINFGKKNKFIWHFEHKWDEDDKEKKFISYLDNNKPLLEFYDNKELWSGCFGGMTVINYDFLKMLNNKYNIIKLIDYIKCRDDRMRFERIIACVFSYENVNTVSIFGRIHEYMPWGYTFEQYIIDKNIPRGYTYSSNILNKNYLPIVKIWTGR